MILVTTDQENMPYDGFTVSHTVLPRAATEI